MVIIITPLAALDPYKEAAAASFRTVIDLISLGLMLVIGLELIFPSCERSVILTATPSITYRGALEAFIDPIPLIRIVGVDPG